MVDETTTENNYYSGEYGPSSTIGFEAPWVEQYRRGFFDNLTNLTRNPMPTPMRGVAGLDPFEMRARSLSGGLGGFQPYLQQAGGAYGQGLGALGQGTQAGYMGAQAYNPSMGQAFFNPYEDQVVQRSLDDVYKNFAQQDMQARAGAVGSGAYGGGRGRLMAQERFNQLGKGMSGTAGQLRSQGYSQAQQQAQNAFTDQQQRMQQAGQMGMQGAQMYGNLGQGIMGLGQTGQQLLRNQMATLGGFGQTARGIQDAMYGSQYDAASQLAKEPYQRMQFLASMMQGMFPQGPTTGIVTQYNPQDPQTQSPWDIIGDFLNFSGGGS
tara:strand:- start:2121 stop:3089 length:969 start_codon:yes stop_codon:yes gene_type:complete